MQSGKHENRLNRALDTRQNYGKGYALLHPFIFSVVF